MLLNISFLNKFSSLLIVTALEINDVAENNTHTIVSFNNRKFQIL
jgi:hypothetical protein